MGYKYVKNLNIENFSVGMKFKTLDEGYDYPSILIITRHIDGSRYEVLRKFKNSSIVSQRKNWDFNMAPYVELICEKKKIEDDPEYEGLFI